MKNIIFIWGDKEKYSTRYGNKAEIYFEKYKSIVKKSSISLKGISFTNIEQLDVKNIAPDIIIAEDEIDTIVDLVKSAIKSQLVNTILICDDLKTLVKLMQKKVQKPKLLTLDFLFDGLKNPAHKKGLKLTLDAYSIIKSSLWSDIPVLGITNYLDAPEAFELKNKLRDNGDELYNKAAIYKALPDIIENRIEYYKLLLLKTRASIKYEIPELISILNKALIEKGIVLEAEIKSSRIVRLLDLQEKVLNFIFLNEIKYKGTTLAGGILYCDKTSDTELTKVFFTHINTTSKDAYKKYDLPEQPLASVQKYFKAFDENGIITKEALIIIQLLKLHEDRWPVSIEKAKQKNPTSFTFVTFLDNIIVLL